ncbi:MAG: NADH-quinone oxidoreductase subunit NuoE [Bauldia sp.]|nr:NADH-quinone oxidoreductase subunit NuoE [Bauldia sp.]
MAVRRLAEEQPEGFAFDAANMARARREIAKYPPGRQQSAIIGLLWEAQSQNGGWLSEPAIRYVAEMLGMPYIRALEVATFYTMFNLHPVGTVAHIQVCGTTPCMLRGSEALMDICRHRIHHDQDHPSADGRFSWIEVECAGTCVNAPMVQIGSEVFEDLTPETFNRLIDDLDAGRPVKPGPQVARHLSEPEGGPTTLTDPSLYAAAAKPAAAPVAAPAAPVVAPAPASPAAKPAGIAAPRGGRGDDLKVLNGIGPKIEKTLHELGVFHFDQIAAWTPAEVRWVGEHLAFPGRIEREHWVEQAKALAAGKGA